MARNSTRIEVPPEVKARAKALHESLKHKPPIEDLCMAEDLANAAPFYVEMRACVAELKNARLAAGLTLAQVADQTGLAPETLSRLETGMLTNPTWKTLGMYAVAVGRRLSLSAERCTD
jgi:DNA-binding XRE family transcriptional regulator